MRQRLAWALFGLTILAGVVHVTLLVLAPEPVLSVEVIGDGFPLVTIGAIAGAGVGALVVSRYPGHRVGWLFVVGQLLSEVGLALGVYGHLALSDELGDAPAGHLAIWLSIQLGGLFVVALLALVFLLAPDGNLLSSRWRWAVGVVVAGLVAATAAVAAVPPSRLDADSQLIGDMPAILTALLVGASIAISVGVLAGAVALVVRRRRSSGEQREQLRWVVLAAVALAAGVLANLLLVGGGAPPWLQSIPVMVAYACVPVLIGVAILRHRLYDIDVFLNRAIVLTALTVLVTVGYVGLVVLLSSIAPVEEDAFWPPFLATVLIALAFQPVRDAAQRLADRLVYGSRAAPYLQLAELSERLQGAAGTEELLRQMGDAVAAAVGARSARVVVERPGLLPLGEEAGRRRGAVVEVPVVEGDETLATLEVVMPPDRPLRSEEHRLLTDFAVQLGAALRTIRLEAALADRVAEVSASAQALEASAHRLTLAQEVERQRFEADLGRTVVPHLRDVEQGIASLLAGEAPDGPAGERRLDELTESTYAALESLRTLTRGIFPAQLARQGLVAALASHLERAGGRLDTELSAERFDPRIESCVYFCVVAMARAATEVVVALGLGTGGRLELVLRSEATAETRAAAETLEDRVAALGGSLRVQEEAGRTVTAVALPASVADDAGLVPHAAQ